MVCQCVYQCVYMHGWNATCACLWGNLGSTVTLAQLFAKKDEETFLTISPGEVICTSQWRHSNTKTLLFCHWRGGIKLFVGTPFWEAQVKEVAFFPEACECSRRYEDLSSLPGVFTSLRWIECRLLERWDRSLTFVFWHLFSGVRHFRCCIHGNFCWDNKTAWLWLQQVFTCW